MRVGCGAVFLEWGQSLTTAPTAVQSFRFSDFPNRQLGRSFSRTGAARGCVVALTRPVGAAQGLACPGCAAESGCARAGSASSQITTTN